MYRLSSIDPDNSYTYLMSRRARLYAAIKRFPCMTAWQYLSLPPLK